MITTDTTSSGDQFFRFTVAIHFSVCSLLARKRSNFLDDSTRSVSCSSPLHKFVQAWLSKRFNIDSFVHMWIDLVKAYIRTGWFIVAPHGVVASHIKLVLQSQNPFGVASKAGQKFCPTYDCACEAVASCDSCDPPRLVLHHGYQCRKRIFVGCADVTMFHSLHILAAAYSLLDITPAPFNNYACFALEMTNLRSHYCQLQQKRTHLLASTMVMSISAAVQAGGAESMQRQHRETQQIHKIRWMDNTANDSNVHANAQSCINYI